MIHAFPHDPVGLPGLVALGLGFVAFLIALFAARLRSARDGKPEIAQRANASWRWVILQGVAIGVAGFGPVEATLDPWSPRALTQGLIVLLLMLGAVGLFDASSRAMGKNWALVARTRTDHSLVTTGPFARVRHPIYSALFLFLLALAIGYGHWRNLIVAVPLYWIATWFRVRYEERLLRAQFGAAYDTYAARVKRFVPGLL